MAPNSGLMDEAALKQWILRRLGSPFLKVELTDDHLKDAIENARRWFSAKKGYKVQAIINIQAGQTEYDLPDSIDSVTDIAFPMPAMDISLVFAPFTMLDDKVPYDVFAAPNSGGLYSSLVQTLQYVETAKRILGAEPDWRQDGRKLYIFPIPKYVAGMRVEGKAGTFTIEQLSERDHDILKRYALAWAKHDLGRVRSKYDSFPTAQGNATLDGDKLLEEARTEMEALDEELALSGFPMGFLVG
jgi:hypothetical protein